MLLFSLLAHFQWFNSKTASAVDDIDEKLQILKYRAELNYFRRQYSDALTNFDAALGNDASQVWLELNLLYKLILQ